MFCSFLKIKVNYIEALEVLVLKGKVVLKRRGPLPRFVKIGMIVAGIAALLVAINFIPVVFLKTIGMNKLTGTYITVYYEKEEAAARDVFERANAESQRVAEKLGFHSPEPIRMYIFDKQSTFKTKKYGYVALLLNLDWYIGDNRKTNVLLTSPANPGKVHHYEEVKEASIHEMVHAYNSLLNQDMPLWVNEGTALYLSNGAPRQDLYSTSYYVPSVKQTRTSSPVEFADMGGYEFAHTYIEYLDKTYGWEKVLLFLKEGSFEGAFGVGEESVHDAWVEFLKQHYS